MGFTRYWVRPEELDKETFVLFSKACEKACQEFMEVLFCPRFTEEEVVFDGFPNCEPFIIERVSSNAIRDSRIRENGIFEYCKTQKLPYDEAVKRCIDLLKEHFQEVEIPTAT